MYGAKQNIKFPSEHFEIPKTGKNWNFSLSIHVNHSRTKTNIYWTAINFKKNTEERQKYRDMPLNATQCQNYTT